ncbi:hypothetical protein PSPO01_04114 [Paraphaeosphaeria sporulosa]
MRWARAFKISRRAIPNRGGLICACLLSLGCSFAFLRARPLLAPSCCSSIPSAHYLSFSTASRSRTNITSLRLHYYCGVVLSAPSHLAEQARGPSPPQPQLPSP